MQWFRSWVVVGACAVLNGAACNLGSHSCTEIGCAGGVFVRVTPQGGIWQPGTYALELSLDDDRSECEISIPDDLPARGAVTSVPCGEGIDVMLQQLAECTETRSGDSVSQSCEPIPGQYELRFFAFQEPDRLRLTLNRDGAELLSEDRRLTYAESRPNGPDCEPVCRQAQVKLAFD